MSSWTNNTKQSAASFTNTAKNAATALNALKGGSGYPYDSYRTYDEAFDDVTGLPVMYDTLGTLPVITNLPKN